MKRSAWLFAFVIWTVMCSMALIRSFAVAQTSTAEPQKQVLTGKPVPPPTTNSPAPKPTKPPVLVPLGTLSIPAADYAILQALIKPPTNPKMGKVQPGLPPGGPFTDVPSLLRAVDLQWIGEHEFVIGAQVPVSNRP